MRDGQHAVQQSGYGDAQRAKKGGFTRSFNAAEHHVADRRLTLSVDP
jgi:hypothetical protein